MLQAIRFFLHYLYMQLKAAVLLRDLSIVGQQMQYR